MVKMPIFLGKPMICRADDLLVDSSLVQGLEELIWVAQIMF